MKLATLRTPSGTRAVLLAGEELVDLGRTDVGALLAEPDWRERVAALAEGGVAPDAVRYDLSHADFAPVVPTPSKVICVGLNYQNHIREMGRELPSHPTLFAKFADCLTGAHDDIPHPAETEELDWEVELAVVVGGPVRRATTAEAEAAIAGFTVLNDVTCRDWQFRTREWLQGKMWDASTPVGPFLVTPDELPGGVRPVLDVQLTVGDEVMQADTTGDLLFDPVALVEYVSTVIRLNPGDLIATGTPGGVGHARTPHRYLGEGETVVAEIKGIGRLVNRVVRDAR
ncbi:fumarylacetoacetate hydrolase family protein [Yinghuangia sp. YIM S09857]|uniref:fumarylacetoacetate hydrolase family protein n=1 Tax=Yinghuangia sp. YIM S09857 TaxID=3436929 RepID=UPI003F52B307